MQVFLQCLTWNMFATLSAMMSSFGALSARTLRSHASSSRLQESPIATNSLQYVLNLKMMTSKVA